MNSDQRCITVGLPGHVRRAIANTTNDASNELPHRHPEGGLGAGESLRSWGPVLAG